jgi:hypothetical protein
VNAAKGLARIAGQGAGDGVETISAIAAMVEVSRDALIETVTSSSCTVALPRHAPSNRKFADAPRIVQRGDTNHRTEHTKFSDATRSGLFRSDLASP